MSFPRYPRYKPSGVEWLGEVPEQWDIVPLYRVATERGEPNIGMKEDNLLSLSYGQIVEKDITSNDGLLPASFETYQVVHQGDIVLRLTDLQNDKRSLRSAIVCDRGIITSAYLALMPRRIAPEFLSHLMRAYDLTKVFYSMGGGLRQSMKFEDLKRMPILLPGPTEQMAIASFLDRETAKIDALVEEQKRLIDLLKEKRQAVITQAVTKGLNPNAPMKSSGIEWLGDVPAHWEVLSIRRVTRSVETGGTPSGDAPSEDIEDGLCWFTPGDFGEFHLEISTKRVSDEMIDTGEAKMFPAGSVLVVGIGATLGKTGFISEPASANQQINAIIPNERVDTQFLAHSLSVKVECMRFLSNASTIGILNQEKTKTIPLAVPPLTEQREIVSFLDLNNGHVQELKSAAEHAVEVLQERRSALISAAVTGKIDVRGLVPASDKEHPEPQRVRANA